MVEIKSIQETATPLLEKVKPIIYEETTKRVEIVPEKVEKAPEKVEGLMTKEDYERIAEDLRKLAETAKSVGEMISKGIQELKEAYVKKKLEEAYKKAEIPIIKPGEKEEVKEKSVMEELGIEKL